MAYTAIEPMTGGYDFPPYIPPNVPKSQGFNFLPPGTTLEFDGTSWAYYYCAGCNISYLVYDFPTHWRVRGVPGKLKIKVAKSLKGLVPCCDED